jgi:predicted transposase YdaD
LDRTGHGQVKSEGRKKRRKEGRNEGRKEGIRNNDETKIISSRLEKE